MKTRSLSAALVALLAACGGTTVVEGTGASATTSSGSTGVGGDTTSSTGVGVGGFGTTVAVSSSAGTGASPPAGPCPVAAPKPGDSCSAMEGQLCTYGDSVRPDCRGELICLQGAWSSTGGTCEAFTCPAAAPTSGAACGGMPEECNYGPELCYCGCPGGLACVGPYKWTCAEPPTNPGCPTVAPNSGAACSVEGTSCSYGTTCTPDGVITDCTNGFWEWQQVACGG